MLSDFDEAVHSKLDELAYSDTDNTTTMYDKMCVVIGHAVETVIVTVTRKSDVCRKVSESTQTLFKCHTEMTGTKAECKQVQK